MAQHDKTIKITVNYTGNAPFHEEEKGNPTFGHIKKEAMRSFDLEQSAAKDYVLQFEGIDMADDKHIDSLGRTEVTFLLTLKREPVKG